MSEQIASRAQEAGLERRFTELVLGNPVNRTVLDRGHLLGVPDWWLTAGGLVQTVWNALAGRPPGEGIRDYDLFYFDPTDTSYEAEDAVVRRAAELFAGLDAVIEVRNEARVHLWYQQHFGVPARPFTSTRDAVDHFPSATCCHAVTRDASGALVTYAPHGYADLFARRLRPNAVLAPREVYEGKAARWAQQWPDLEVLPWPDDPADGHGGPTTAGDVAAREPLCDAPTRTATARSLTSGSATASDGRS